MIYTNFPHSAQKEKDLAQYIASSISWANGTEEQLVKMREWADKGYIKLKDYWKVGDTRSVSLKQMPASSYSNETQPAQTVQYIIADAAGRYGTDTLIVSQKSVLNTPGLPLTITDDWNTWSRRNWLHTSYYNAMPEYMRKMMKRFSANCTNHGYGELYWPNQLLAFPNLSQFNGVAYYVDVSKREQYPQFQAIAQGKWTYNEICLGDYKELMALGIQYISNTGRRYPVMRVNSSNAWHDFSIYSNQNINLWYLPFFVI